MEDFYFPLLFFFPLPLDSRWAGSKAWRKMRRRGRWLIRWLLSGMAIVSLVTRSWGQDTEGKRKPGASPRFGLAARQSAGGLEWCHCLTVSVQLHWRNHNNNVEPHVIAAKTHELEQKPVYGTCGALKKCSLFTHVTSCSSLFFNLFFCCGQQNNLTLARSCGAVARLVPTLGTLQVPWRFKSKFDFLLPAKKKQRRRWERFFQQALPAVCSLSNLNLYFPFYDYRIKECVWKVAVDSVLPVRRSAPWTSPKALPM